MDPAELPRASRTLKTIISIPQSHCPLLTCLLSLVSYRNSLRDVENADRELRSDSGGRQRPAIGREIPHLQQIMVPGIAVGITTKV